MVTKPFVGRSLGVFATGLALFTLSTTVSNADLPVEIAERIVADTPVAICCNTGSRKGSLDARVHPGSPIGQPVPIGPLPEAATPVAADNDGAVAQIKNGPCNNHTAKSIDSYGSLVDNLSFNHIHQAWDYRHTHTPIDDLLLPSGFDPQSTRLPTFQLSRIHRYRDIATPGSFGPGVFCNYDTKLFFGQKQPSGGQGAAEFFVDLFDPQELNTHRFIDGPYTGSVPVSDLKDGTYVSFKTLSHKELRVYDSDRNPYLPPLNQPAYAELEAWDGRTFYFEVHGDFINHAGRLTRIQDRNGYSTHITYRHHPDRDLHDPITADFWTIDQVTDAYGNTAQFTYAPQQVAGQYVLTHIDFPNGGGADYTYSNGFLAAVQYPDGEQSTFTRAYDTNTHCTVLTYLDAGVTGPQGRKKVYLTNNYTTHPDLVDDLLPQSAFLVRMILNGADEVAYLNIPDPVYTRAYIYEGGNRLKHIVCGWETTYARTWVFNTNSAGQYAYSTVAYGADGDKEYLQIPSANNYAAWYAWMPTYKIELTGQRFDYQRDADGFIVGIGHYDGTTNRFCLNHFKQITSAIDRLGRNLEHTFDAQGNVRTETLAPGTAAEATTTWEYYPAGHPSAFLLQRIIDPNGNPTDFQYDGSRRLVRILAPADTPGGDRPLTQYDYDTAGRLIARTDPEGRRTQYQYDLHNRLIAITDPFWPAPRTRTFTYGTGQDLNLLVRTDDTRGNRCRYSYDRAGRLVVLEQGLPGPSGTDQPAPLYDGWTYLPGTQYPLQHRISGKPLDPLNPHTWTGGRLTQTTYDHRIRTLTRTTWATATKALTASLAYSKSLLLYAQDPYGRKTWYHYNGDKRLTRLIREAVPGVVGSGSLPTLQRDLAPNARWAITDIEYDSAGQVLALTDPRGVRTLCTYDTQGRLSELLAAYQQWDDLLHDWTFPQEGTQTRFHYDPAGNLIARQHPRSFQRQPDGTFLTVDDIRTTHTFTPRNLLAQITDAPGRPEATVTTYTYLNDGAPRSVTDGEGHLRSLIWQEAAPIPVALIQPPAVLDDTLIPSRATRILGTDTSGRRTYAALLNTFDPASGSDWYRNPPEAQTLEEQTLAYDARGRLLASTHWLSPLTVPDAWTGLRGGDPGTPSDYLITTWQYDEDLTDGAGLDADYAAELARLGSGYFGPNSSGAAVQSTAPDGRKTLVVVDGLGRTVLTLNGNRDVTRILHDTLVTDTIGKLIETQVLRDPAGLALSTRIRTDGLRRQILAQDPAGQCTRMQYDPAGNLLALRDPNGNGFDRQLDALGREIRRYDTLSPDHGGPDRLVHVRYDPHGNLLEATDALDQTARYSYDPLDRLTEAVDRLGHSTHYTYDRNHNLLALTDAEGHTTHWDYDARGFSIAKRYPGHHPAAAPGDPGYDQELSLYDAAGRLFLSQAPDALVTRYHYDPLGRLLQKTFDNGTPSDTFTYDPAGRLLSASSGRYANTVSFTYDPAGRLLTEALAIDAELHTVSYAYDTAGRHTRTGYPDGRHLQQDLTPRGQLAGLTFDSHTLATFAYDPAGREATRTTGNGLVRTTAYRADDIIRRIQVPGVLDLAYTHDANKRQTGLLDALLPAASQALGYDLDDRLIAWNRAAAVPGLPTDQTWTLSPENDWSQTVRDGVPEVRAHDAAHRLTDLDGLPVVHDRNSNVIGNPRTGHVYTWDEQDRLLKAFDPVTAQDVVVYRYDALGRRVKKTTPAGAVVYCYSGNRVAAEVEGGLVVRAYVYAAALDEPVAMLAGGATYYLHHDQQYSVTAVTDAGGTVVERYVYGPYGERGVLDGAGGVVRTVALQPYGYTGRRHDPETGLLYYRARYLDPGLGRFLSRDPIAEAGGINLFAYCANNPANSMDPLGLAPGDWWDPRSYFVLPFGKSNKEYVERLRIQRDAWDAYLGQVIKHMPTPGASSMADSVLQRIILKSLVQDSVHAGLNRKANYFQCEVPDDNVGIGALIAADYEAGGSVVFELLPIAGSAEKAISGEVIDDRAGGTRILSTGGRAGYGTLAVVEFALIAAPTVVKGSPSGGLRWATRSEFLGTQGNSPILSWLSRATGRSVVPPPIPGAQPRMVKVYRGVRSTHPGYDDAVSGVARPRRPWFGHRDPALHNAGNTKSQFTSWTTDRSIAKRFAGSDGVILEMDVPEAQLIGSPDKFHELEVLIRGIIEGAMVSRP